MYVYDIFRVMYTEFLHIFLHGTQITTHEKHMWRVPALETEQEHMMDYSNSQISPPPFFFSFLKKHLQQTNITLPYTWMYICEDILKWPG